MGVGERAIKRYSAAEYRNAARLAARGAGFEWGVAEDIGHAAVWLASRELPFCLLARAREVCAPDEDAILRGELTPSVPGKMLCPFVAGVLICDLSRVRLQWKISRVSFPLMLAPFAAFAARAANSCVKVRWRGAEVIADGERAAIKGGNVATRNVDAHIAPCPPPRNFAKIAAPVCDEYKIAAKEWRKLNALAARTFVPASDESRMRGAGAAEDDG